MSKAQAQAQAIEQAQAQARAEVMDLNSNGFINAMISVANNEDIETREITVGEKELTDITLKTVTVTAQTIRAFQKESTKALCCELAKLDKETAKHDGFSVSSFIKNALPDLAYSTAHEYYVVGRMFGNPTTHTWKSPIPSSATVSNLSAVAKALCNTEKIDEATEKDLNARFAEFITKYIETGLIHLNATEKDLRKEIKDIKNPAIPVTATEVTEQEQEQEQEQAKTISKVSDTEQAQEAFNILFAFFRGNDKAIEALTTALAELPVMTYDEQGDGLPLEQEQ